MCMGGRGTFTFSFLFSSVRFGACGLPSKQQLFPDTLILVYSSPPPLGFIKKILSKSSRKSQNTFYTWTSDSDFGFATLFKMCHGKLPLLGGWSRYLRPTRYSSNNLWTRRDFT